MFQTIEDIIEHYSEQKREMKMSKLNIEEWIKTSEVFQVAMSSVLCSDLLHLSSQIPSHIFENESSTQAIHVFDGAERMLATRVGEKIFEKYPASIKIVPNEMSYPVSTFHEFETKLIVMSAENFKRFLNKFAADLANEIQENLKKEHGDNGNVPLVSESKAPQQDAEPESTD
ncbi:hypothetical protein ACFC0X_24880 [Paenibacillus chitinolyticus]|uniref:hypothetical protein n=1 Tax=Paenibacillus chitinolyticus TaxID=79263 RepID=UPI0035DA2064